jgi:DNA-binding GntR family transcriptional regulator
MPTRRKAGAKKSQALSAYDAIEAMIVRLELAPGSRISEKALSQALEIGRTPVREALQRLAYERLVHIVPRAGAIVSEIDLPAQFKLIEVRRELERILIRRAARLVTPEVAKEFRDLAERFDLIAERDDGELFVEVDREFNTLVYVTAHNDFASDAMGPLQSQTRRFWYLYFRRFGDLARVCGLHAEIARAIAAQDEERAGAASDGLIDYVEDYSYRTMRALM